MAIISVPQEPEDYRTVYNPIEYVAESDAIAEDRFKYLFDVYDGATQIARFPVTIQEVVVVLISPKLVNK